MLALTLALAMLGFGLFLLLVGIVLLNAQRQDRKQLRRTRQQAERFKETRRSPAERAARRRRIERIEARNRVIHGRFDSGGC